MPSDQTPLVRLVPSHSLGVAERDVARAGQARGHPADRFLQRLLQRGRKRPMCLLTAARKPGSSTMAPASARPLLPAAARGGRPGRSSWQSVADGAVNPLTDQVSVAVVAGVFLDHVLINPAQRSGTRFLRLVVRHPVQLLSNSIQVMSSSGRAGSLHAERVAGKVSLDMLNLRFPAVLGLDTSHSMSGSPSKSWKPGLDPSEVPDQAHEGEAGRRAGRRDELLRRQTLALHQERRAMELKPALQRFTLAGRHCGGTNPLGHLNMISERFLDDVSASKLPD